MVWKNLKQRSLADALIVEHAALTGLDNLLYVAPMPIMTELGLLH